MKNYLEKRREELRKRDGGFTLMEMLIVVAIIAVLIAIAIPVFTSQLERSREATDMANVRSAYAECSASVLSGSEASSDVEVTKKDGVVTATKTVALVQTNDGWETEDDVVIGGVDAGEWGPGSVTITVTDDGADPTFTYTAATNG